MVMHIGIRILQFAVLRRLHKLVLYCTYTHTNKVIMCKHRKRFLIQITNGLILIMRTPQLNKKYQYVKIFSAHMVILNYRSSYLRRILSTNKKER